MLFLPSICIQWATLSNNEHWSPERVPLLVGHQLRRFSSFPPCWRWRKQKTLGGPFFGCCDAPICATPLPAVTCLPQLFSSKHQAKTLFYSFRLCSFRHFKNNNFFKKVLFASCCVLRFYYCVVKCSWENFGEGLCVKEEIIFKRRIRLCVLIL